MATTSAIAASSTTSATASIVKTLGSGSGLDTGAIVTGLVQAQFAVKNAQLSKQADTLSAQISAIAKLKSGITGFDTALQSLVKGGTLTTQPTSSAASVAGVSGIGTGVAGLAADLTVNRLASAQAATTNDSVARDAAFATGTLSVTIGGTTTAITIDAAHATLDGIAAQFNAGKLGVTATVVTDGSGARLTFKGQTGAANAFTIAATDDDGASGNSLSTLSVGAGATGTTIGTSAADAELVLDGATFHRATNSVADLVPGVTLTLTGTGHTTLGTTAPTAAIGQAVSDFVDTYNALRTQLATETDPKTGELRADPAAQALLRSLAQLPVAVLTTGSGAAPRTLADLGVKTNRDGSLSLDATQLADRLRRFPDAAEAMFAGTTTGGATGGLSAALTAIATRATAPVYGFDAETARFTASAAKVTDEQGKAADDAATMTDRLTAQFATMDARVAAYKSTQTFLQQQVDVWTKSND